MSDGTLLHVCVSAKKGIAKHAVPSVVLEVEHGISEDAHAGDWHRQVSLLAHRDIEYMRAKGLKLKPGAFGENLVIDGLDTDSLGVGSQLRIGPALLEMTQVGKVCHTRCAIYYTTGDCIMPRTGLFTRVLKGGTLTAGMPVEVVHLVHRETIQAAVLTVSDRCSAGTTRDTSGPALARWLVEALHARIAWHFMVPDEKEQIEAMLKDLGDRRVDLIVTTGGTGLAARDVTPEATLAVIDREVPGIAEAMRAASLLKTPNAMLSRSVAGVRRETLIVNVPGSQKAALENLEAIRAALPHAVSTLREMGSHPENDNERLITLKSESEAETAVLAGTL